MSESTKKKTLREQHAEQQEWWMQHRTQSLQHWRSWGSWFSWGSPVGLGLFFIALAITIWIIRQAF